MNPERKPA